MKAVATSKLPIIAAATTVAGAIALAFWLKKSRNTNSDDDDESYISDIYEPELPTHMMRAIHKEQRRKASVQFLAMKKPMYDNIEMYSPQDEILCTISVKKANWYIRKNLATWKGNDETKIKLLFAPKGKPSEKTVYTTSQKQNICVSCGEDKHHMRHYVVPYCYRTLLPEKYKTHMPHDIVIMCPECHLVCEQATQKRQKQMEAPLRKDPQTALSAIPNSELYHVRSCALALYRSADRLPPAKLQEYEALVRSHYKLGEDEDLTAELIQSASEIETHEPNPKYIPGPELVAETLTNDEEIADFIRDWRDHFLVTMQPRYLPKGWSVDSPVHSDYQGDD